MSAKPGDALPFLTDMHAAAACILLDSGLFCTADIATLLDRPENAVERTIRLARDQARGKRP